MIALDLNKYTLLEFHPVSKHSLFLYHSRDKSWLLCHNKSFGHSLRSIWFLALQQLSRYSLLILLFFSNRLPPPLLLVLLISLRFPSTMVFPSSSTLINSNILLYLCELFTRDKFVERFSLSNLELDSFYCGCLRCSASRRSSLRISESKKHEAVMGLKTGMVQLLPLSHEGLWTGLEKI